MNKSYSSSIKMNKQAHIELNKKVISDGYGMRGKSKWITEAIATFLSLPDYIEFVNLANDDEGMDDVIAFRLSNELVRKLDAAIVSVRTEYPAMEGVRSKIIRASILQRLIRG
ncbi:MAG: hypothetical protein LEGION0398_MBIBDBAK_01344 [Legionellaceae bacterium]